MRNATVKRTTKETDIEVILNLDGNGEAKISTGIGFFDHMLTALCVHAGFDLSVKVKGDLDVDCHHTIEDTGIVLGEALNKALDKASINRYGTSFIPMDEALGFACVDIFNRPFLVFECDFKYRSMGDMDTQMVEEFLRAFAFNAKITLHAKALYGNNDHHKAEAIFKAVAHSLKEAVTLRNGNVLTTKGTI